ncbi:MAG: calcium/sodium antiporter [Gammaproteobacteria bacterium]|nr:calcium/sodium antiporter [Gammaproteobacteria bacterium]MDX2462049.1 calcium/sodium antiporter [Gammaproteobacteria bacterium]
MPFFAVVLGLALLVWGSDRFVFGASATARNFGVPPLLIGLTIVGAGTSAPEVMVAVTAALSGNPGVVIGNALGSNIANIGLVLGVTALIRAVMVRSKVFHVEFPIMFAVMGLAWFLLGDGVLDQGDGVILGLAFILLLSSMVIIAARVRRSDPLRKEFTEGIPADVNTARALLWLVVGLVALLLGSKAIVWGAVSIARSFEVSDLLIGLTVVAVGTSLPELAASIASVLKNEPDIAVGNVIGSNMFNLLPVLALPGLIAPTIVPPEALQRDFPVMLTLSVALVVMAWGFRGVGRIARWEGGVLVLAFLGYQGLLYLSAS